MNINGKNLCRVGSRALRRGLRGRGVKLFSVVTIFMWSNFSWTEENDLRQVFEGYPIEGTIYLESLNAGEKYTFNQTRALKRFTVASTFKIPNTLIALQEDVVSKTGTPFKWSGENYTIKSWNADQSLESAYRHSCVWCYQEIARYVGDEKYKHYLSSMSYGDLPDEFELEQFWLDGTLKLNALEQVAFLKKLYSEDLPFDKEVFSELKGIMKVESAPNYSLYAKTGWAPYGENPVGWYVGYVESPQETWFFATNLKVTDQKDLRLRKKVTLEALEAIGAK